MISPEGLLVGRVALITGGSRGKAKAVDAIKVTGIGKSFGLPGDVVDAKAVLSGVTAIEKELGPVSILVNSAGQSLAVGPIWETDAEIWWHDIEVNLRGTFLVTQAVVRRMIERSMPGCVINLTSAAGNVPLPMASAYACSKAAVQRFTDSLAISLSPHQIVVFALSPGTVHTDMTEHLASSPDVHRWMPEWRELPSERWTPVERVSETAVLLASGKADALSGRFIHVNLNVQQLIREADRIRVNDLYTLRLREPESSSRA